MKRIIYIIGWGILTLMIVNDLILLRIWAPPDDVLPYSRTLQAVLDLTTRLFDGQGVSAAIIDDDKGYWAGTSGCSEPAKPVKASMLFNIASVGKNFLAALIVQLADEGRVSLDDPISKWIGSASIDGDVTIRQLLRHTSGIYDWVEHPRSPFRIPYREIDYEKAWTTDEILNQLSGESYFSPGTNWHYSTTNYNLLKIVAEKVTGSTVPVEIRNRFLQPLGLDHTIILDVGDPIPPEIEIAHGWLRAGANGELEDISSDSQNWIISLSPAMMYASALDLAKWSQALYGGQVLSRDWLGHMVDFHRPTPNEPPLTGYGLGTAEIAVKGLLQSYGHLGYHYGNMSAMLYFPKEKISLVVLTNENNPPFQYGVAYGLLLLMKLRRARYLLCSAFLLLLTVIVWKRKRKSRHQNPATKCAQDEGSQPP